MVKNYSTIALRNLLRNKGFSAISILGLVVGMAGAMLTLRFEFYTISSTSAPFFQELGFSFSEGWDNLRAFSLTLVSIWPFLLLAPMFWFLIRKLRFRKSKKEVPESF